MKVFKKQYINKMKLMHKCPICREVINNNLGKHILKVHGEKAFKEAVLKAKEKGMPDVQIGALYGITFRQLEKVVTEAYGINISVLKRPKRIKYWRPKDFKEETTTVWSFKRRGDWATHNGRYRGNWSPYIPRNVILKYSKPSDVVLDYFVGGGTTAVEAKLLGRRCIARDINPACIGLTLENLNFKLPRELFEEETYPIYEPQVSVGDARDLSDIGDNYIDLICAHPPYAGIIRYSSKVEGDLSKLSIDDFLKEMAKVAKESYRVLKPGGKCAILIGDTRRQKHVIPIGFKTINIFLNTGFKLKELVIKRQHNCKTTGFWYEKSIKYNFLLLAHEYLPIFEKPKSPVFLSVKEVKPDYGLVVPVSQRPAIKRKLDKLETTTVWIFPQKDFEKCLNKNVIDRYSNGNGWSTITFISHLEKEMRSSKEKRRKHKGLLFIKSPFLAKRPSYSDIECYLNNLKKIVDQNLSNISKGRFLVIQTQDVRINEYIEPLAKRTVDAITSSNLWLKEIVIVTQEGVNLNTQNLGDYLEIAHQYLLVYEVIGEKE